MCLPRGDNYHRKGHLWGKFENIFLVSHSCTDSSRASASPFSWRNELRQGKGLCGRCEAGGQAFPGLGLAPCSLEV